MRNTNFPPVNSSAAPGNILTLVMIKTSNNNDIETIAPSTSSISGSAHSVSDILTLVEMMNQNTFMFHHPFAEVRRDYESSMLALERAKDDDDDSRVMFYDLAVHNLFKELQSMDA